MRKELKEKELEKVTGGVTISQSKCTKCGACARACPVGCIYPGESSYNIDQSRCIGCGTCADVCPVNCIGN